jgi:ribonuclease HII
MQKMVVGVDEVGRGCWAGPLVVGAVLLHEPIKGLADSKVLSAKERESLTHTIVLGADACNTGWVSPGEIDALGLTAATGLGIKRALEGFDQFDEIIIDGSVNFWRDNPKVKTLIKADALVPAVSAASILAKVVRDRYMKEQDLAYPLYGFGLHVGYGTARHKKALLDHGITPLHRLSYKPIQAIMQGQSL